ncbi:MAG: hypothetical protein HY344_02985 [Candidatus Levybacteria bacterium]|nr:hypothetical protein [Candidatus Levybacteria bacterium]
MLRKIFTIFVLLFTVLGIFLFKSPSFAANEFAPCSLINKPTRLDVGSNLFPANIAIDTNGNAIAGAEYNIWLFKPGGGRGNLLNRNGSALIFNANPDGTIGIPFKFDHNGKIYEQSTTDTEVNLQEGTYFFSVTEQGSDVSKCQNLPDSTEAMGIHVYSALSEAPASPNSCPLCQNGYAWNNGSPYLCVKGQDYKHSIERVDCSSQGTSCVAGRGYCENPGTPELCKTRNAVGSSCNASLKDPGECADGLVCQDSTEKCVRPQTSQGRVCYKCRSISTWDGTKCVGPLSADPNACIEPETREYCGEGFTCNAGKGCKKLSDNPSNEIEPPQPLKTPCEKNLSGGTTGQCYGIFSGLGVRLPTDPLMLISKLLEVILGVAGGIVIILIIRAGYKLMFSQGNPEKVQEARDELTSAIVGLMFIVFSFVLLQFIANDLLQIDTLRSGAELQNVGE